MAERASDRQVWLYAIPAMAVAFVNLPASMVLPTFYVEHTTATLGGIGLVNLLRWWFDAATDPMVGYLSDHTRSRWGRRKPWMAAGAVFSAVAVFMLFRPDATAGVFYYGFWLCAVYLGFTMFSIPHMSWGSELAVDYNDRARISMRYSVMTISGSLLFWILPIALSPLTGSTEIGPVVVGGIGWIFVVLLPLGTLLALRHVPRGQEQASHEPASLLRTLAEMRYNKPLLRFVAAQATWGIGQGMYLSVIFLFMRDYMKLGDKFPVLMIWFFIVQTVSMPAWGRLMARFGKHRSWAFSWAAYSLVQPVVLLFEPGGTAFVPALAVVTVTAFLNGAAYIGPMAVLGDISDYGTLKSGRNNTGNYFAMQSVLQKANMGIGAGVAFPLLALFGYRIGEDNGASSVLGLVLAFIVIPAATSVTAAAILWNFPLDARRHAIIRKRLDGRSRRLSGSST